MPITSEHIMSRLKNAGVIAVMRNMTPEHVVKTVQALQDGGVTAIEITVENAGGLDAIKVVKEHFGESILLGAGTIVDGQKAEFAIDAGVDFIVTPIVSEEAIRVAKRRGCFIASGAMTPTEIHVAYEAGADLVKVFPADSLGPDYLKNVKGPLGHIPLMPTGGINLTNMAAYVKNGAVCVGVGGALYQYDNPLEIKDMAKKFMDAYHSVFKNGEESV